MNNVRRETSRTFKEQREGISEKELISFKQTVTTKNQRFI
jgi:hypothetical protein